MGEGNFASGGSYWTMAVGWMTSTFQPHRNFCKQSFLALEAFNHHYLASTWSSNLFKATVYRSFSGHWACVSTIGCNPGHVNIYDSLFPSPPASLVRQLCCLLQTKETQLTVNMMHSRHKLGGATVAALQLPLQQHFAMDRTHHHWYGSRARCSNISQYVSPTAD